MDGWSVVWYGCAVVCQCRLVGCVMVEPSFVRGHGRRRARRTTVSPTLWTPFPFRPVHAWLVCCWPACVWSVYGQVAAAAGRTPGRGQRRADSTSTAGSRWRLSRNRRRNPPLSPTYAPSSRSTRSGHWRWVGSCSPPSALRRRPGRRTWPWCTRSSVPSAAPLYDVRVTPEGPDPRPTTGPAATTHGRTRTALVPHQPRAGKKRRGGPGTASSHQRAGR